MPRKELRVTGSKPAVVVVPIEGFTAPLKPKGLVSEPSIQIRIGRRTPREAVVQLDLKQARELAEHLIAALKSLPQTESSSNAKLARWRNRQTDASLPRALARRRHRRRHGVVTGATRAFQHVVITTPAGHDAATAPAVVIADWHPHSVHRHRCSQIAPYVHVHIDGLPPVMP